MLKKILSLALALLVVASLSLALISCKKKESGEKELKVGVILVGDETEGYTLAHMQGIEKAAEATGISKSQLLYKKKVEEDDSVITAAQELIAQGCSLIISNSYGHQDFMAEAARANPDVNFVAATGDFAAISGIPNLYNAFTRVYESRYVSGVVAGLKLKEMIENTENPSYTGEDIIKPENKDENGNIRIGYVGAYAYAEVVSGYTAFYLGIKSVVPNVVMEVEYTNSWFSIEKEGEAANKLMADNCVIIGQHADSTGAPAAVEAAHKKADGNYHNVYSVGYNVSMLEAAPNVALTSPTNEWSVYYTALFNAAKNGTAIPQDFAEGYAKAGVAITALGKACAPGTAEKVAEVEAALKNGTLKVFDNSTFTVGGNTVTTNMVDFSYYQFPKNSAPIEIYHGATLETMKTETIGGKSVTYFDESTLRAAPYFSLRIDGITENASTSS